MRIHLINTIGSYEPGLIFHFARYYRKLGVTDFHLLLHSPEKNYKNNASIYRILEQESISADRKIFGPWNVAIKSEYINSVLETINKNDWVITADLDEFYTFPIKPLKKFFTLCDKKNISIVRGTMVDRIAYNGSLKEVELSPCIWRQFPLSSKITSQIRKGNVYKILAHKGHMRTDPGHHSIINGHIPGKAFLSYKCVHHFRWTKSLKEDFGYRMINVCHHRSELNNVLEHIKLNRGKVEKISGPVWIRMVKCKFLFFLRRIRDFVRFVLN
jgi:hypothetical protein